MLNVNIEMCTHSMVCVCVCVFRSHHFHFDSILMLGGGSTLRH